MSMMPVVMPMRVPVGVPVPIPVRLPVLSARFLRRPAVYRIGHSDILLPRGRTAAFARSA